MAVIGRNRCRWKAFTRCLLFCIVLSLAGRYLRAADASSEARGQVAAVARALSSGDAAEAMTHFAKTCPNYDTVRRYFEGLGAFQVDNQLTFTDEEDADNSVTLTITWDITLSDFGTENSRRRTGEIHVKVAAADSKWRIVEFSPLDIFNPQLRRS